MKPIIFSLLSLLPLISRAQIVNGGFETWDTTYVNAYSDILHTTFGIPDPLGGIIDHWTSSSGFGVSQTTDSYAGDYSLILHNWYGYAQEWIDYYGSINYRPASFIGYYKYDASNINGTPHGYATVTLTRFNGSTNDTIGIAQGTFTQTLTYTPFEFDFDYRSPLTPDSIHIYFINADRSCDTNIVCHFLYLDELRLSDHTSWVDCEDLTVTEINMDPDTLNPMMNVTITNHCDTCPLGPVYLELLVIRTISPFDTIANSSCQCLGLPENNSSMTYQIFSYQTTVPEEGTYTVQLLNVCDSIPIDLGTAGIDDAPQASNTVVAPNPSGDWMEIRSDFGSAYTITITDVRGHVVLKSFSEETTKTVDVRGIAPGVYFVILVNKDGQSVTEKVVKE